MVRLLWILGEVLFGVLVSGGIAALVVPIAEGANVPTGPWVVWVIVSACVLVAIVAGERLRKRMQKPDAA